MFNCTANGIAALCAIKRRASSLKKKKRIKITCCGFTRGFYCVPGFFLAGQQRWLQEVTAPRQEVVKHITPPPPEAPEITANCCVFTFVYAQIKWRYCITYQSVSFRGNCGYFVTFGQSQASRFQYLCKVKLYSDWLQLHNYCAEVWCIVELCSIWSKSCVQMRLIPYQDDDVHHVIAGTCKWI